MGKLGTFGERLTELMAETELTAKGLAERLGVSSSTVYRWKNDACSIRLSNLIAVSDFFEATFDFLLGRCDDNQFSKPSALPRRFDLCVRHIMKEVKMSIYKMSIYKMKQLSRYDGKSLEKWRKSDPTAYTLEALADLFDCSVDHLLGRD